MPPLAFFYGNFSNYNVESWHALNTNLLAIEAWLLQLIANVLKTGIYQVDCTTIKRKSKGSSLLDLRSGLAEHSAR